MISYNQYYRINQSEKDSL